MEKIKNTNRWLLGNLFWIVPFNFALIIFGIGYGAYQRYKLEENQYSMKYNDSIRGVKMDSVNATLKSVISLEHTLEEFTEIQIKK